MGGLVTAAFLSGEEKGLPNWAVGFYTVPSILLHSFFFSFSSPSFFLSLSSTSSTFFSLLSFLFSSPFFLSSLLFPAFPSSSSSFAAALTGVPPSLSSGMGSAAAPVPGRR